MTAEKNVASVKSSLVIHASKQAPGYPIEVSPSLLTPPKYARLAQTNMGVGR